MTVAADADGATLTITSVPSAAQAGPVPLVVHATAAEDTALVADASTDLYVAGIPGADDTSFGMDGFVELEVLPGRYATTYEAAVDGEGRLVVAGALQGSDPWAGFVVRVLPDGSFDDAFGDLGVVTGFGLPQSPAKGSSSTPMRRSSRAA